MNHFHKNLILQIHLSHFWFWISTFYAYLLQVFQKQIRKQSLKKCSVVLTEKCSPTFKISSTSILILISECISQVPLQRNGNLCKCIIEEVFCFVKVLSILYLYRGSHKDVLYKYRCYVKSFSAIKLLCIRDQKHWKSYMKESICSNVAGLKMQINKIWTPFFVFLKVFSQTG